LIRQAVAALIIDNGKVLLGNKIRIQLTGDKINEWNFPRGGIAEGEDKITALFRELKEETGTDKYEVIKELGEYSFVVPEKIKKLTGFTSQNNTLFLVKFKGKESDLVPDGDEIAALKFFPIAEARKIIHKESVEILDKHAKF
jgi:putative (di)nucleoside polyphosphate hydrolase